MDTVLQELVSKIKGRKYPGSSIANGVLYHDLPFRDFSSITSHRKGTADRWNLIKAKSGIDFSQKTILDIGCSAGAMSLLAAQDGANVLGIDYDEEALAIARYAAEKLGLKDVNFHKFTIDLGNIKNFASFDVIIWLSQWMWCVKQFGMDVAKDMLFEVSRRSTNLIFESAADDAMAAIKGATQQDLGKWLWENTMYSQIQDIGFLPAWNNRHIYVCKAPISFWKGYTARIERISRGVMRKRFRQGLEWMVAREIQALTRLKEYPNFPRIKGSGVDYVDLSYCGNREGIKDRTQCEAIMKALAETNVIHRDINPKNLITLNGQLFLCDFGWCLFDDEKESPVPPPQNVLGGRKYPRKDSSREADETAMNMILGEAKLT
jgi:SAM-dependent methyltransferase